MSLYFGVIRAILSLKRTCPKCKNVQVGKMSQQQSDVPCKNCGAPIPPPKRKN